jgi:GGDEF domain-containing protein
MFAALLPEATPADAEAVMSRVRGEIERPFATVDGIPLAITASFAAAELDAACEVEAIFASCRETLDCTALSAELTIDPS